MRTHSLKRSAKNRWIVLSVIAVTLILSGASYYYYSKSQFANNNETNIETSTIGTGDIVLSATGFGALVPSQEISFGFKNRGKVSEVLVNLGDKVGPGEVLARLENTTLELEYKQAEANLAALSSLSGIAAAEQAVQDAKESFLSAKDDLQFLIGPDLLIAEENLTDAQQELQRANAALAHDASQENKQKVVDAETALTKAEENLAWARNEYIGRYVPKTFTYPIRNDNGITIRRELIAPTDVEVAAARAAYDLAKANLSDAEDYLGILKGNKTTDEVPASSLTSMTDAKIALDRAKANLDATELTAPISGTITSMSLNVGSNVGTAAVVTISNMTQPYVLDLYLDETDWDKAKVGNVASVTFDLFPDQSYSGKITQVYPTLDDSSGTPLIHILLHLDAPISADLPSGASASVDITGGKALGAILVPASALKEVEPGKYVVYLMMNGQPVEREVEIGLQDILNAEVKSGLQPGDVVLTNVPAAK